eukprot:6107621-Prymnesium_polylepis.1
MSGSDGSFARARGMLHAAHPRLVDVRELSLRALVRRRRRRGRRAGRRRHVAQPPSGTADR